MEATESASTKEFLELGAYLRASSELRGWIDGTQAFALMSTAVDSGLLRALSRPSTVEQIAAAIDLSPSLASDLCDALAAHGVVVHNNDTYQLAPDYARLAAPEAVVPLDSLIRQTRVMVRTLEDVTSSSDPYTTLPTEDVLAMAEAAGISSLSTSPHVAQESTVRLIPELGGLWHAGAHHLEAGCGVGNSLLGIAVTYPAVTAVGIEIDEATAAEARRRAEVLAVADRVEVRCMDAGELHDEEVFDTAQWSQFYFPAKSRTPALQAMHRALKPGGFLLVPFLGSASEDWTGRRRETVRNAARSLRSGGMSFLSHVSDLLGDTPGRRKRERRSATLQALLFARWEIPVRNAAQLATELEEAGFTVLRDAHTAVSPFYHTRGLLLARRST